MITNDLLKKTLKDHDSFALPTYLQRVTVGMGGEAILIFASAPQRPQKVRKS